MIVSAMFRSFIPNKFFLETLLVFNERDHNLV